MSIENETITIHSEESTTAGSSAGASSQGATSQGATSQSQSGGPREAVAAASGEARHLADEAKQRASSMMDHTRQDVTTQLGEKTHEASGAMRRLAEEFGHLAMGHPDQAGRAREYVEMAEQRLTRMADRLDYGGPDMLIDDVRGFARRHPAVFLGIAVGAGFGLARLARTGALNSAPQHNGSSSDPYRMPPDVSTRQSDPLYAASGVVGVAV